MSGGPGTGPLCVRARTLRSKAQTPLHRGAETHRTRLLRRVLLWIAQPRRRAGGRASHLHVLVCGPRRGRSPTPSSRLAAVCLPQGPAEGPPTRPPDAGRAQRLQNAGSPPPPPPAQRAPWHPRLNGSCSPSLREAGSRQAPEGMNQRGATLQGSSQPQPPPWGWGPPGQRGFSRATRAGRFKEGPRVSGPGPHVSSSTHQREGFA